MDIKVFGSWDFYHWGKGWDSAEQARDWDLFWKSFNETHPDSRWRYLEIGEGVTQEHLLVCGQCVVWLHPMNYTAYYHGSGVSVQTMEKVSKIISLTATNEELEKICKEVAEVCNGTYSHKETEVEIITKE